DGGDGDIGVILPVPVHHLAVIHFVNVVARENQRVFGVLDFDALEVLKDGVGRALVPVLMDPLHRGDYFDEFTEFGRKDVPSIANVPGQFQGFVLGQDENLADVRIDTV